MVEIKAIARKVIEIIIWKSSRRDAKNQYFIVKSKEGIDRGINYWCSIRKDDLIKFDKNSKRRVLKNTKK
jgi:hypothetical protein